MKIVNKCGAQGDVLLIRVKTISKTAVEQKEKEVIVAHSETGHHHKVVGAGVTFFKEPDDPFTAYLRLADDAEIIHCRSYDTHETIKLPAGDWLVRRAREYTPQGYRMVQD